MPSEQGKGGLEAGETKSRKKENADEQAKLRLGERVRPLIYFGPRHHARRIRLAAFAQDEPAQDKIEGAETRGHPTGALLAE